MNLTLTEFFKKYEAHLETRLELAKQSLTKTRYILEKMCLETQKRFLVYKKLCLPATGISYITKNTADSRSIKADHIESDVTSKVTNSQAEIFAHVLAGILL